MRFPSTKMQNRAAWGLRGARGRSSVHRNYYLVDGCDSGMASLQLRTIRLECRLVGQCGNKVRRPLYLLCKKGQRVLVLGRHIPTMTARLDRDQCHMSGMPLG